MYVTAIVLAAGRGLRLKSRIPKPLVKINYKSIIFYCLNTLSKHPEIKDIIVVVNSKNQKDILSKIIQYKIGKIKAVVGGGKRRQDSVINGLKVMDRNTDLVLIHDGVRPFIDKKGVSAVIREAKRSGAAILGVPVKATIKSVKCPMPAGRQEVSSVKDKFIVKKTLNRDSLWEIQTPQVFKKELILKAYKKIGNIDVTDDAVLAEKLGAKVSVVLGSYNNIKITTPEDLVIARTIAKKWNIA